MNALTDEIKGFIISNFPSARKHSINNEDSLLESGIIDSLGVLEVVSHLVEHYGIEINDDDLMPENFNSVQSIAGFIQLKRNGS